MKKNKSKKEFNIYKLFIYVALISLAITIIIPVLWVFMASVKDNQEFYQNPWQLPKGLKFSNFKEAIVIANMGEYFFTSVMVTGLGIAILLAVSVPCAYALSRFEFKGRRVLNSFFHAGIFVNVNYIVVPIFLMLLDWDILLRKSTGDGFFLDNRFVLALVYASTAIPFTIYLLSNYFRTIPKDFEEAASVDGASHFRTMMTIMVPMAKPSIITVILFNFLAFWNEYIIALTLMPNSTKTLPVGLINLMQSQRGAANYGPMYAGLVIVMLPTLILYILVQKKLTEGMTVGGVKG